MKLTHEEVEDALTIVRRHIAPTPAYTWPLLTRRAGVDLVIKHENHTPTGAFKIRGGLVFVERLQRRGLPPGLVTATRGNHGQSIAASAKMAGIPSVIFVPEGNSVEKNAAMEAFGCQLKIVGKDFDEAREAAAKEAALHGFLSISPFDRDLVSGVATYAYELLTIDPIPEVVFVPIGLGSSICAMILMRDLLGLKIDVIGVVAEKAPALYKSFKEKKLIKTATAATFADGIACRAPHPEALDIILKGAADVIMVSEEEIADAIRIFYTDTHNLAEGAGAAALAGFMKVRSSVRHRRAAVVLTGGNIDRKTFLQVLMGKLPTI